MRCQIVDATSGKSCQHPPTPRLPGTWDKPWERGHRCLPS